jgi:peroxiredoxin
MTHFRTLVVFILIFLTAAACRTSPEEGIRTAPEIGAYAPDFTLADTAGQQVTLSELRGSVVLINFWATWCPPCRLEMPGIQDRYERHGGDLVVLAIDNDEPLDQVAAFRDELGLTFEPLLDPAARVQMLYLVRAYPTSLFVNEHGIIQFVHIGLMTESQLDDYLSQMGLSTDTTSN